MLPGLTLAVKDVIFSDSTEMSENTLESCITLLHFTIHVSFDMHTEVTELKQKAEDSGRLKRT